jgi:hypothetical protein
LLLFPIHILKKKLFLGDTKIFMVDATKEKRRQSTTDALVGRPQEAQGQRIIVLTSERFTKSYCRIQRHSSHFACCVAASDESRPDCQSKYLVTVVPWIVTLRDDTAQHNEAEETRKDRFEEHRKSHFKGRRWFHKHCFPNQGTVQAASADASGSLCDPICHHKPPSHCAEQRKG